MKRVAFATYQQAPEITDDDKLVADQLRSRGVSVEAAVWDDHGIAWTSFDAVVIRSTWDYHLKVDAYVDWLMSCKRQGIKVLNPPELVLDNLDKRYLGELAQKGIAIVPCCYVTSCMSVDLRQLIRQHEWTDVVIKPAVSASAHGTWRSSLAEAVAHQPRFEQQLCGGDLLIQPYIREIVSDGEWSLVFFAGEFSHAAFKRPAAGDFRVQEELGGRSTPAAPAVRLVEQAAFTLSALDSVPLYARVDGVDRDGQFLLMELEINEPALYLGFSPDAAQKFADAIGSTWS